MQVHIRTPKLFLTRNELSDNKILKDSEIYKHIIGDELLHVSTDRPRKQKQER